MNFYRFLRLLSPLWACLVSPAPPCFHLPPSPYHLCSSKGVIGYLVVEVQFNEIIERIGIEKAHKHVNPFMPYLGSKNGFRKKKPSICVTISSPSSGNCIISYYFGSFLDAPGVTGLIPRLKSWVIIGIWWRGAIEYRTGISTFFQLCWDINSETVLSFQQC